MAEFRMPSLGSDMQEGTLIEWRVKPGDQVKRRDIIAVVETDKAAIEIEVYEEGVIETLLVQPGEKVPVGTVMARIRTQAEPVSVSPGGEKPQTEASRPTGTGRIKVSPYARRLAAKRDVDLGMVKATGPGGAIRAADVEAAAPAIRHETAVGAPQEERPIHPTPPAPAVAEKAEAHDRRLSIRRAIAAAMARSKREIPHYYLQTRIDMSRTLAWLESENIKRPIKDRLLPAVALIRAVSLALGEVPELNGYWIEDHLEPQEAIHIGFAIALRQGGLVAPAILNADEKSLDELMQALRDLITRTRTGGLRSSELTAATVTVTSLGDLGVEAVYGIIYPPQVALVGFGKTMEQPWAQNGMLAVRPVLTATLSGDHRATDGHQGAQFLDALNGHLQEPSKL